MTTSRSDAHYEVLAGLSTLRIGTRTLLPVVVYVFTSERDARSVARETGRKVFRVEGGKRTEMRVRRVKR